MHIKPMKIKRCMYSTLLGLKNMTMYERVKPATAGLVDDTYLELKMLCLFYFVLESEKIVIIMFDSIFPLFYCLTSKCQLILGSIHPAVYQCNGSS